MQNKLIDYSPLTSKISFLTAIKRGFGPKATLRAIIGFVILISTGGMFFFVTAVNKYIAETNSSIPSGFSTTGPLLVATVVAVILLAFLFTLHSSGKTSARLEKFCEVNGFKFMLLASPAATPSKGLMFSVGDSGKYVTGIDTSEAIIGNYSFTIGSGDSRTTVRYAVASLKLDKTLPHIVFDNKKNDFIASNLPVRFSKDQKISLEGNFDEYFDTYIPDNYQVDVLSFVTPELMQILIAHAVDYDVEIVDDELFLYRRKTFKYAEDLPGIFAALEAISSEFNENAEHYRDDRVATAANNVPTTIAGGGKRLRKKNPVLIAGFIVFVVTGVVMSNFSGSLGQNKLSYVMVTAIVIGVVSKMYRENR